MVYKVITIYHAADGVQTGISLHESARQVIVAMKKIGPAVERGDLIASATYWRKDRSAEWKRTASVTGREGFDWNSYDANTRRLVASDDRQRGRGRKERSGSPMVRNKGRVANRGSVVKRAGKNRDILKGA